jgi:hypothetical protein
MAFRGGDPTEPLALARLACQVPTGAPADDEGALLARCDELLAEAERRFATMPDQPRAAAYVTLAAQLLAGTPRAAV